MKKTVVTSAALATFLLGTSVVGAASASVDSITMDATHGTPSFIGTKWEAPKGLSKKEAVLAFLDAKQDLFKVKDAKNNFKVNREVEDKVTGTSHFRLQETYKGIPIYGADQSIHMDAAGNVQAFLGTVIPELEGKAIPTQAKIAGKGAIQIAMKRIAMDLGSVGTLDNKPEAQLNIFPVNGEFKLAYVTEITFVDPKPARMFVAIDAVTGEVLQMQNLICDHTNAEVAKQANSEKVKENASVEVAGDSVSANVAGSGTGVLGNTQTFDTNYNTSLAKYTLDSTARGLGVSTYSMNNGTSSMYYITNTSTNFGTLDRAGVDAHAYAEDVYDYYKSTHNRNSIDNAGMKLISRVHYSTKYNNAFWNGAYMTYGDGDGVTFRPLSAALDVVAHELTHGVTEKVSGLIYSNESGALNESMSDIFGAMVDRNDWLMGEDIYTPATAGDALRSLSTPTLYGDPDHYSTRYTGTADNGGVHTNSGINNKAAFLLSDGGTHYGVTVTGIGRLATEKIYYRANDLYLTSNSNFAAMRAAAIQAATDLYGSTSAQVTSVKAAYSAVGVN